MTLTVGTDTYISVADANEYVNLNYLSSDPKFVAWDKLCTADREILLRRSTQGIEALKYPGAKYASSQALAFPRALPGVWPPRRNYAVNNLYSYPGSWTGSGDVPAEVKAAQVEEALELIAPGIGTATKQRSQAGIESVSILHFSEKYRPGSMGIGNIATVISSTQARTLLSRFKNGSFRVV